MTQTQANGTGRQCRAFWKKSRTVEFDYQLWIQNPRERAEIYEGQYKDEIQRGEESANSNDGEPTPKETLYTVESDGQMPAERPQFSKPLFVQTTPKGFGRQGTWGARRYLFAQTNPKGFGGKGKQPEIAPEGAASSERLNASQPPSQESTGASPTSSRQRSPMPGKGPLPRKCTQTTNGQTPETQPRDVWNKCMQFLKD